MADFVVLDGKEADFAEKVGLGALTSRELEILGLAANGDNNTGIADRLVITTKTVEKYLEQCYSNWALQEMVIIIPECRQFQCTGKNFHLNLYRKHLTLSH
jgi:FixJ family two-component response regulator